MGSAKSIFWFRRDLRLHDNAALYYALKNNSDVLPIFIFDKTILDQLENKKDARVHFIFEQIQRIKKELNVLGSTIQIFYGRPTQVFAKLIKDNPDLRSVYANQDYEPNAIKRDDETKTLLAKSNIEFNTYKDHCIFEKNEVIKDDGKPYTIFTPYKNKWLQKNNEFYLKSYPNEKYFHSFIQSTQSDNSNGINSLKDISFQESSIEFPELEYKSILKEYHSKRDIPSIKGTSRISLHLRFGTVSIRELVRESKSISATWLNELIWRDFYFMILFHFPYVVNSAFKPNYNHIKWRNNEEEFKAWCNGQTGYPIVDAGMRELNSTGFMHNRVRMIVASFLTKHLLIDWRWGEAYFAEKLLDFELSSNNGGWQWAAGCGCDAAPYFRIFNPYEQTKKFDADFKYIRKWVPEFQELAYPKPIVEHTFARVRCLEVYKMALTNG